jgi:polyisoprenoid-binding protein YceI
MLAAVALALTIGVTPPTLSLAAESTFPLVSQKEASTWVIDATHSELSFSVRHLISKVRGQFNQWSGNIVADPEDWGKATIDVTIQTASITTGNEKRDGHLRTGDFFDATQFPTITFKSTKVERTGNDIKVSGNLTMRGVTKPVVLTGKMVGMTKEKSGKLRAGFEASGTINRMDYGVSWNRAAEGGGAVLGDEVTINLTIAAVQQ